MNPYKSLLRISTFTQKISELPEKELLMHLKETGAIYDARHEEALSKINWSVTKGYARSLIWDSEAEKVRHQYMMHRLVWELEYGKPVPSSIDHINGNRLDNRVENLRAATLSLQALNNKGSSSKASGLPVGVYHTPKSKKNPYLSTTRYKGKDYHLGSFPTPEQASQAYLKNRQALIDYEAAMAKGESPEMPLIMKTARLSGREVTPEARDRIASLATAGRTVRSIAKELGLSTPTVRKYVREAGAPVHEEKRGRPSGRDLAIKRFMAEIQKA